MVSWWSWGLTDTSLLLMSDPCVSAATAMEAPVGPAYQTLELPQLSSRFASPLNLSRSVSLSLLRAVSRRCLVSQRRALHALSCVFACVQ